MVFHGIQPDWIEEEMADDREFKRDVLEQRVRSIIRDQVQWFKCGKRVQKITDLGRLIYYCHLVKIKAFW